LPSKTAKTPDLNWNDLRHVLAVARARALAPAARGLGVNETTVARRIACAEQSLGSKLFDRVEGAMIPTEAGEIAVTRAEQVETAIDLLKEAAFGVDGSAAGVVRISSIPLIVNHMLTPALKNLYSAHPNLQIEAFAEPRNVSLTRREADIALRLARPDREHKVIARRIGKLAYAVYGPCRSAARPLPWIAYDAGMAALPHVAWIAKAIRSDGAGPPSLIVNDSEIALHAIRAGVGRSLLPCAIGDREPGLARLGGSAPALERELWLLVLPELRNLARIKAVIDWLDTTVAKFASSNV
jgi:DNA-binding transcriptional LysR family regulator